MQSPHGRGTLCRQLQSDFPSQNTAPSLTRLRRWPPHPGSPKLSPLLLLLSDWWFPLPLRVVARTAAAKTGRGSAAGAVATVALADAVAPAGPAAAAAAASPPPPSASNSEPVETGSDWEIPSRLSFQPMAPRSVWNLGLRPQPARLLACSSHSRAISPPLIGQIARQSHLKSPHEPAASAPASFQQRFARRVGEGSWGGPKKSEKGGVEEEEAGQELSPAEERAKRSREEDWFGHPSIKGSPPSTSRSPPAAPPPRA